MRDMKSNEQKKRIPILSQYSVHVYSAIKHKYYICIPYTTPRSQQWLAPILKSDCCC